MRPAFHRGAALSVISWGERNVANGKNQIRVESHDPPSRRVETTQELRGGCEMNSIFPEGAPNSVCGIRH